MVYFKNSFKFKSILFFFFIFFGQILLASLKGGKSTNIYSPKYKTELCKNYPNGKCKYGENCSFAHGQEELKSSQGHVKFKISPCKNELNGCQYKDTCFYQHVSKGEVTYLGILKWLIEKSEERKLKNAKVVLKNLCEACEKCPQELLKMNREELERTFKTPGEDYTLTFKKRSLRTPSPFLRRSPVDIFSAPSGPLVFPFLSEFDRVKIKLSGLQEIAENLDKRILGINNDPYFLCLIRNLELGYTNKPIESAIMDGYQECLRSLHEKKKEIQQEIERIHQELKSFSSAI
jgi:hypothetical protein